MFYKLLYDDGVKEVREGLGKMGTIDGKSLKIATVGMRVKARWHVNNHWYYATVIEISPNQLKLKKSEIMPTTLMERKRNETRKESARERHLKDIAHSRQVAELAKLKQRKAKKEEKSGTYDDDDDHDDDDDD